MTVHFLLRRSKADGQEHSLDVQRAGCAAFCAAKGFHGAPVEHVSDGVAGDDVEGLAALRELLDRVKPGDIVVCRDHSRLGRDMLESATSIRMLVEDRRALLFYFSTGEQVQWRNATDAVMSVLRGFGSQMELEAVRSRTREALRARVKAARIAGGECYGYSRKRVSDGGKESTVAVVNEQHAEVIRRVFAEFVAGAGYKRIAKGLNDDGIPFPAVGKRGSGSWSQGQIFEMVRRERYAGVYVHGVTNRVKKGGKRVCVPETDTSKIMRVEIPEWRIVDDITWRRAQAIIGERAPRTPEQRSATSSANRATSALGGFARCGLCGGAIGVVGTRSGRTQVRAYGCITHHNRGAAVCSAKMRRPVHLVEDALADALKGALERPDVVDVVLDAVRAEVEAQALSAASVDVSALEAERVDLRKQARNLSRVAAQLDGDVPAELLAELKSVSARATQVEKALTAATRAPVEAAAMVAQAEAAVRARLADFRAVLGSGGALSRDFLRGALTEMTLTPTDDHRVIVETGLDLRTSAVQKDWRPQRDSNPRH